MKLKRKNIEKELDFYRRKSSNVRSVVSWGKSKSISILEYINYILFFNQFRIYAIYF